MRGQKTELREIHLRGEAPHWAVVPSKKKKKKKKKKRRVFL
jgi:hypothetical protein